MIGTVAVQNVYPVRDPAQQGNVVAMVRTATRRAVFGAEAKADGSGVCGFCCGESTSRTQVCGMSCLNPTERNRIVVERVTPAPTLLSNWLREDALDKHIQELYDVAAQRHAAGDGIKS